MARKWQKKAGQNWTFARHAQGSGKGRGTFDNERVAKAGLACVRFGEEWFQYARAKVVTVRYPVEGKRVVYSIETRLVVAAPLANRWLRFIALLVASWCVMTIVHELGHIVCGWACGGKLVGADLRPWHLPYSFFRPDPYPLVTLWGGPVLGVLIPWVTALVFRAHWLWFVAYFCMLANGSYLAAAWVSGEGELDTPKLLANGAHPIWIVIYCILTIGLGYVGFRQQCGLALSADAGPTPADVDTVP